MVRRRVFLIWTYPLFKEVVSLLLDQSEVELLGATSDHAEALDLIADLKPDVVMVEVAEGDQSDCEETISILQVSPRVICLSLDNNEMKIYQRHDRMMTNVEDLFSLINESGIDGHPRGLDT